MRDKLCLAIEQYKIYWSIKAKGTARCLTLILSEALSPSARQPLHHSTLF